MERISSSCRTKKQLRHTGTQRKDEKLDFGTRSQPSSLVPTLVILPSMSRVPRAPFTETESPPSLDRRKDSRPPAVKLYLGRCPRLSTVTLTAQPAMSRFPIAPFAACEPLERFRPQATECSRCQRRVNHAIEKMLERDQPASAVPNRFLGVGCAVS
jgi:hypothetical protein